MSESEIRSWDWEISDREKGIEQYKSSVANLTSELGKAKTELVQIKTELIRRQRELETRRQDIMKLEISLRNNSQTPTIDQAPRVESGEILQKKTEYLDLYVAIGAYQSQFDNQRKIFRARMTELTTALRKEKDAKQMLDLIREQKRLWIADAGRRAMLLPVFKR